MQTRYWYSFDECLDVGKDYQPSLTLEDRIGMAGLIAECEKALDYDFINPLASANISLEDLYGTILEESNLVVDKRPLSQLMYILKLRYGQNYIGFDFTDENMTISLDGGSYLVPKFFSSSDMKFFIAKFSSTLIMTYPKYKKLLDIYQAQENKLMDGLKTSRSGSTAHDGAHSDSGTGSETHMDDYTIQADGKNLRNDTPVTTDVVATIEGNQYVNGVDKSSATTHNTGTTGIQRQDSNSGEVHETGSSSEEVEMDMKYTMEKIAEIQDSYQQLLRKWSDEFTPLFIEEENLR